MSLINTLMVTLLAILLSACGEEGFDHDSEPTSSPTSSPSPTATPTPTPTVTPTAGFTMTSQEITLAVDRVCGTEGDSMFTEMAEAVGLSYVHSTDDTVFQQSGGVAAGDFDGDGWVDLYAVGGSNRASLLLKNQGDGTFTDVAESLNVNFIERNSGPAFGDFNGDGWLDLFVGAVGGTDPAVRQSENRLLLSQDGLGFSDVAQFRGVLVNNNTFSATWGDYDNDDDVDLLMAHWIREEGSMVQVKDNLWRNNNNVFEDVSEEANISLINANPMDSSFAPTFSDVDNDGDQDILVTGDALASKILMNNGDGTFTDRTAIDIPATTDVNNDGVINEDDGTERFLQLTDRSGMGSAVGDYDNDGDFDWFVSAIDAEEGDDDIGNGNRLYENDGTGVFSDATDSAGVRYGFWGWGACFADFDSDGFLDIFHVNGMYPIEGDDTFDWDRFDDDPSRLFMNNGDKSFTERSVELGIDDRGQGRGVTCLDYDRDGDIDIMIANNGEAPKFYCNRGNSNNYINIRLKQPGKNVFALGAKIQVVTADTTQIREIRAGNNYLSQNPAEAHFGLGSATTIDQITVTWPDGERDVITDAEINKHYTITRTAN